MLKKISLPLQLIIIIIGVGLFGNLLNETTVNFFYSLSLLFKECLSIILPFIIFSFVTTGILSFKKNALLVLTMLFASACISNTLVAIFSYIVGINILPLISTPIDPLIIHTSQNLVPLFSLHLPRLLTSIQSIFIAIFVGLSLSFYPIPAIENKIKNLKTIIEKLVNSYLIPIIPLYVFGYLLEMHHQGLLYQLFHAYSNTFALIIFLQWIAIFFIYFIAAQGQISKTIQYIKNAMPSYLTALGTMSSTATISVTVQCTEKNTGNKAIALMGTPILASIHLLGNAISIPMLALVTFFIFNGSMPDPIIYSTFLMYFCINSLAASGLPGGTIFVMHPIFISVLGFNEIMTSVIITLYMIQDGFCAAGNVMGDGALMIIMNKILKRLNLN